MKYRILLAFGEYDLIFLPEYTELVCRESVFDDRFQQIIVRLAEWKDQRFPPPRVSQSQVGVSGICDSSRDLIVTSLIKLATQVSNTSVIVDVAYLARSVVVAVGLFPWLRGMPRIPFSHEDVVRLLFLNKCRKCSLHWQA